MNKQDIQIKMDYIFLKNESYQLLGLLFEVHNNLGGWFR